MLSQQLHVQLHCVRKGKLEVRPSLRVACSDQAYALFTDIRTLSPVAPSLRCSRGNERSSADTATGPKTRSDPSRNFASCLRRVYHGSLGVFSEMNVEPELRAADLCLQLVPLGTYYDRLPDFALSPLVARELVDGWTSFPLQLTKKLGNAPEIKGRHAALASDAATATSMSVDATGLVFENAREA